MDSEALKKAKKEAVKSSHKIGKIQGVLEERKSFILTPLPKEEEKDVYDISDMD